MQLRSLIIVSILSACSTFSLRAAENVPANAIGFWKVSAADNVGGVTQIPDVAAGNNVTGGANTGIYVETDKEAGNKKVVYFDGMQTAAATSNSNVTYDGSFVLNLRIRPTKRGADWQTVLYFFGSLELRYRMNKGELALITWAPERGKVAAEIRAPVMAEEWNDVSVVVADNQIELTVNGQRVADALPAGTMMKPIDTKLSLGFGPSRPFTGALGDVALIAGKKFR